MSNSNWFIESISLVKAATLPTKQEMEKLLPSSWPPRWEEYKTRYLSDGVITVWLAHINPDPEMAAVTPEDPNFSADVRRLGVAKYEYFGVLSIAGYGDKQTAKQFFESYQTIPTQGLSAPTPGASMNIPLGDLVKAFAPKEIIKEFEYALEKGKKDFAKSGVKIEKGKYLGEEALFQVGKNGKMGCMAVLINNFVITGLLLMSDGLDSGGKRIHAIKCKLSYLPEGKHPRCSTLKAEGFIHKEEVEQILRSIFSKIKGEKEEAKEIGAEIIRGSEKIKNPKKKFEVKSGDRIKTNKRTEVTLITSGIRIRIGANTVVDMGDFIVSTLPGDSRVKIKEPLIPELSVGTLTAIISKLKPLTKFEIRTPTGSTGVRGTIFSVWTDKTTTSLTVIEGEVEFSDLKGNKTIVRSNQTCVCSKEQGLQQPVTIPINLREQFKGL